MVGVSPCTQREIQLPAQNLSAAPRLASILVSILEAGSDGWPRGLPCADLAAVPKRPALSELI